MLITRFYLRCDRCGHEVEVELDRFNQTLADAVAVANVSDGPGWEQVVLDKSLCPRCSTEYRAIEGKHAREIQAFFSDGKQ